MICDQASQECDLCDQVSQDCDLLGENSRLLQFTKCSGKHIFKVREKSGNFTSWRFEEKPGKS